MNTDINIENLRVFAESMHVMAEGMRGMEAMKYYRLMFIDASKHIANLCDYIEEGCQTMMLQKEKNEGEKEMRDIPPTPPIESKAKEGEEKKDRACSAYARERRINKEADEIFNAFWSKYPIGHKVGKDKCHRKVRTRYRAALDKARFANEFLGGLDRWLASDRWARGLVCNPETWINQERWLETPERSTKANEAAKVEKRAKANAVAAEIMKEIGL